MPKVKRKPRYKIILVVEGATIASVTAKAKATFGENLAVVRKVDPDSARQDRLNAAKDELDNVASTVEELRDELQEWFDNLPESLQAGEKGTDLEEAIGALETIKDELEAIDFETVSFPAMMG